MSVLQTIRALRAANAPDADEAAKERIELLVARGFIRPDEIGDADVVAAANEAAARAGVTEAAQYDPRFSPRDSDPERERLSNLVVEREVMRDELPDVRLSDFEGSAIMTGMADRTAGGETIRSINDVQVDVPLYGGQDFMVDPRQRGAWANAEIPGRAYQSLAQRMKEMGADKVYIAPWRMTPTGGDFSAMPSDAMLAYAQANMTPDVKRELDKEIRDYVTLGTAVAGQPGKRVNAGLKMDWPGIDDPRAIEAWR